MILFMIYTFNDYRREDEVTVNKDWPQLNDGKIVSFIYHRIC